MKKDKMTVLHTEGTTELQICHSKVAQELVLEAVLLISLTNNFVAKTRKSKIMKSGDSDLVKLDAVIWGSITKNIMQN